MLGARRGLLGGVALLVLFALLGGSAHADRLADRQAEADRVQAELSQMDADLSKAIEAYDRAQSRLDSTEAAIRDNAQQLDATRRNLEVAQAELSKQLVADYRTGDPDEIGVLLGAGSMSEMLERIDIVKRSSGRTARLVGKVLSLKKQFERRTATLAKQRKAREEALAERAARKATITSGIRARKDRLASVKRDIRQIIAAREAAERAAAAARAAAARAAQEAAEAAATPANDPGIGGSSDADDGGGSGGSGGSGGGGGGGAQRWRRRFRRAHPAASVVRRLVGRRCRALAARRAVPVGRCVPERRLRLLRPDDVGLRAGRRLAAAQRGRPARHGHAGRPLQSAAR